MSDSGRDRPFPHYIAVSTPDAHVAQCALDRDAILLSRDAIFEKIARVVPLRVVP